MSAYSDSVFEPASVSAASPRPRRGAAKPAQGQLGHASSKAMPARGADDIAGRVGSRPLSCTAASLPLPPRLHGAAAGPEAVPSYASAQPLTPQLRRPSLKKRPPSTSSRIDWEMASSHRLLPGQVAQRPPLGLALLAQPRPRYAR